jgi:hypothetical protein
MKARSLSCSLRPPRNTKSLPPEMRTAWQRASPAANITWSSSTEALGSTFLVAGTPPPARSTAHAPLKLPVGELAHMAGRTCSTTTQARPRLRPLSAFQWLQGCPPPPPSTARRRSRCLRKAEPLSPADPRCESCRRTASGDGRSAASVRVQKQKGTVKCAMCAKPSRGAPSVTTAGKKKTPMCAMCAGSPRGAPAVTRPRWQGAPCAPRAPAQSAAHMAADVHCK